MRTLRATITAAAQEAFARRGAFAFEIGVIVFNNFVWVAFWLIFFNQVPSINGWTSQNIMTLLSLSMTIFGISAGLFYNSRHIGEQAIKGELDAALTLPTHPLSFLLFQKFNAIGFGDLLYGITLFLVSARPNIGEVLLYFGMAIIGVLVLTSYTVVLSSIAIYMGNRGEHASLGYEAISLFSMYPLGFFNGATKLVLYTALPAAFMTGIPVTIIEDFSWLNLGIALMAALFFVLLARSMFNLALRNYRSGSQWN